MPDQLTNNADALRLFFTEDIYLVKEPLREEVQPVVLSADRKDEPPVPALGYETFNYLGKNKKHILILVNDDKNDVSTEKGNELLRNIVKAINLTANDFALLNYSRYPGASYQQLYAFFSSKLVFCFGVSADDLGLAAQPLHEIGRVKETEVVICSNLEQLAEDLPGKKALWGNLKKLNL